MNKAETLALYAQGKDAWNAWAADMQARREELETAGTWHKELIANFGGHEFEEDAEFGGFVFPGYAEFHEATFSGDAGFGMATFSGDAGFDEATFSRAARFDEATFSGDAGFGKATFSGNAGFDRATFWGEARFDNATFSSDAWFNEATFSGDAGFDEATFSVVARFGKATFLSDAWFNEATFSGIGRFGGVTFSRDAGFEGATFSRAAWFDEATFSSDAGFDLVTFSGDAKFDGATFSRDAWFGMATFSGDARFAQCVFDGFTSFADSTFENAASFSAIDGKTSFSLAGARFREVPDFNQAHFAEAPRLDVLSIEPRGFKSRFSAAVKAVFNGDGSFDEVTRWSELKRLAVQRHDHQNELAFFRGELLARRWVADKPWHAAFWAGLGYQVFSGFGHSIFRPLAWWSVSVIGFAWAYLAAHVVAARLAVGAWSSFLFTVPELGKWIGGASPFSCMVGPGDPVWAALGLSLQKALVAGLGSARAVDQIHACLFDIHHSGPLAKTFQPVIPGGVSAIGVVQLVWSAAMIFLLLLALRNHFRIK